MSHQVVDILRATNPCVSKYILAEVFGQWNQMLMDNIRRELCNRDVHVKLKADVGYYFNE